MDTAHATNIATSSARYHAARIVFVEYAVDQMAHAWLDHVRTVRDGLTFMQRMLWLQVVCNELPVPRGSPAHKQLGSFM